MFHSPTHDKPLSLIPLAGCSIAVPALQSARFEELLLSGNSFRANQGFEFDIRHVSRPTIRFCATSLAERDYWVGLLNSAANTDSTDPTARNRQPPFSSANTVITGIKLVGLSLQSAVSTTSTAAINTTIPPNQLPQSSAPPKQIPIPARSNSFSVSAASMMLLEKSLQKKVNDQMEARNRERTVRTK